MALLLFAAVAFLPGWALAEGRGGTVGGPDQSLGGPDPSNQTVRVRFQDDSRCLRLVAAGVNTKNASSPTTGGVITLPPVLGPIVWAGLYWVTLADGAHPNVVTLNGTAVTPVALPVTFSPCRTPIFANAYFALVTPLVIPGPNVVAGLDDSGTLNVSPETEGASLVVVYESATSGACEIIVMDGNDLLSLVGQEIINAVPVTCATPAPGTLYFVGGDGQPFPDDQRWNGVVLGDGDDFDDSDPETVGAGNGWDTDGWAVIVGPNVASISNPATAGDCIDWVVTALEVNVQNCQTTPNRKSTWGTLKTLYR
ncbi:MAG TPA: hypothetical protein VEY91_09665 [Candidatus Limnocylindria bacterium]|nr:hypothetical protein [Candidatus Limnocylindria bacterium]